MINYQLGRSKPSASITTPTLGSPPKMVNIELFKISYIPTEHILQGESGVPAVCEL